MNKDRRITRGRPPVYRLTVLLCLLGDYKERRDDYEAIIHKKDIQIKMLEHDVAKAQNETISSRKAWSDERTLLGTETILRNKGKSAKMGTKLYKNMPRRSSIMAK